MNIRNARAPEWLRKSIDLVQRIRSKTRIVRKVGQQEIRRGLEKVTVANEIEREVDYLQRILVQDHPADVWNDTIVTVSGTHLAGTLDQLYSRASLLANYARSEEQPLEEQHGRFMLVVPSTDSSSGSAVYIGAALESRIQAITLDYHPLYLDAPPERLASREQQYKELMNLLVQYDPKFVSMLEGSEAALDSSSPDHLSQAAHSMRDLFQQLIEHLAPSKVVEDQPWFQKTQGAPGGVSRRSRLRYLLYGSGEPDEEGAIEQLDIAADSAKQSLDLCIARAHDHDPTLSKQEVQLAIDQARFSLARILEMHNELRQA